MSHPRPRLTSRAAAVALSAAALAATVAGVARADHPGGPTGGGPADRPVDAACDHFWPHQNPAPGEAGVVLESVTVPTGGPGEEPHPATEVTGCVAYPVDASGAVAHDGDLVVMVHGLGHTAQNAWAHHLVEAAQHGAVAISVNFRDNFGFPALWGAHDVINATIAARQAHGPFDRTILVGTSMGGAVSGTAIVEAVRFDLDGDGIVDRQGLYDLWIDIEGVTNLMETYSEARAALPAVADAIERDAGGTPWEVPFAYDRRSPVTNAGAMYGAGLRGVITVHGVADGLVGFHQSRTMATMLRVVGLPVEHTFVVRGKGSVDDTVLADHAGAGATFDAAGLTGHAWEGDRDHPVVAVALDRLVALLDGAPEPVDGETVRSDGDAVSAGGAQP